MVVFPALNEFAVRDGEELNLVFGSITAEALDGF
jgi:hypothetical protein